MALAAQKDASTSLVDVIDRILDKGLIINADIAVSVAGVELLGIKIRAALASFETAAKYGLEFPAMTKTDQVAWQEAMTAKETCPQCGKRAPVEELLTQGCAWCGWIGAKARRAKEIPPSNGHRHEEIPLLEA